MYTCVVRSVFISTIRWMSVLGKLVVSQLIKKVFTVYDTRSSITTHARHLGGFGAVTDKYSALYISKKHFTIILLI